MIRGDFISIIQEKAQCKRVDAERVLDTLGLEIQEALGRGEDVNWSSLFKLKCKRSKETTRRNPKTQEKVLVPSKMVVYFKAAKALKDAVNHGSSQGK
jgi:nucleoid DNA-binding protein